MDGPALAHRPAPPGPCGPPVFRTIGFAGYAAALLTVVAAAPRSGVSVLAVLGISATAALSFWAWALTRRAITGREELVALEHVWVAAAMVALWCRWAGTPVAAGLDVLVCGVGVFLAVGRVGCHVSGCCYGMPSTVGCSHPVGVVPARLAGVRLFPVQLVEAAALTVVTVVALVALDGPPGAAALWFALAHAVVRFGVEGLRADPRPAPLGVSLPRWMCLLQFGFAASMSTLGPPAVTDRTVLGVAVVVLPVLVGALVMVVRARASEVADPQHLDELWQLVVAMAARRPAPARPAHQSSSRGVQVAVSWDGGAHVSLSVTGLPAEDLDAVARGLGAHRVHRGEHAVHLWVGAGRLPGTGVYHPIASDTQTSRITEPVGIPAYFGATPVAAGREGQ